MSPRKVERPEGLSYRADFISIEEDRALLAFVEGLAFREVTMRGYPAKRRTVQFGVRYEFDQRHVEPTDPIPPELLPLRDRCAMAAGVDPEAFAELLATRYPAGAGIGWHRDAPQFGSVVAGISLATACTMKFRKKVGESWARYDLLLEPRSLYVLAGAARWQWQHGITETPDVRYSLTFRTLATR
ncbi:MAG TPA: alpha-ketoglutarate-dependent dioxygenase AlkB [Thermoanaerobaculia bacterium]|nr:alpha-ketoglutarate-dependent dioxygenase AlkB [Thermoanaerobaculia bacterium]